MVNYTPYDTNKNFNRVLLLLLLGFVDIDNLIIKIYMIMQSVSNNTIKKRKAN